MSKQCPSCGYAPIGPFIDNCPMCAEPVRNVRSTGSGFGSGWFTRLSAPVKLVILAVGLGGVVAVGCCGIGMWRMANVMEDFRKDAERAQAESQEQRKARTVVVSAEQMVAEFRDAPREAEGRYGGKCLEVTGVVDRVGKSRNRGAFLILHGGDPANKVRIQCTFEAASLEDEARLLRLRQGDSVKVRGEYGDFLESVQITECEFVD